MKHLKEVNETYLEHLVFAWSVAIVLIVHGLCPFVWEDKASNMIKGRANGVKD
jgi:hypothetical protein